MLQFVGLLVSVFLISCAISYFSLKSSIIQTNVKHLDDTIVIIALELERVDDIDQFIKKVAQETSLRVSITDIKGAVVAKSSSDRLKIDSLYAVKKVFYNNREVYLRLSMDTSDMMDQFYTLWYKLFASFVFIAVIAFFISKMMSKRILYDINQITKYLDEIANKNYGAVIKTRYFYEFLQISLMLKNLVKKLNNKEKQKEKYMAKLKQVKKQRDKFFLRLSKDHNGEKES